MLSSLQTSITRAWKSSPSEFQTPIQFLPRAFVQPAASSSARPMSRRTLATGRLTNPVFGRTNNPWDLERTPGGEHRGRRGGARRGPDAPRVWKRYRRLDQGAGGVLWRVRAQAERDRASEERPISPAHRCPTPRSSWRYKAPLARSAVDLELAFDVVAGPDLGEDAAWRLEVPPARHDRLSDYRVAVMPSIGWLPVDSDIESATTTLAEDLRRIGCSVSEVQPAAFGDLRAYTELYYQL